MSVLCPAIPNPLIALALRRAPQLAASPLALLGDDDRVWAVSDAAQTWGVAVGQQARQAHARCPHLLLHPLNMAESQSMQEAFVTELARWELPMEEDDWGRGYIDLHSVATNPDDVRPLAQELGRRIRSQLGMDLQPGIGWDSGKFVARAASTCARPGALRMVGVHDETRFLSPLSVQLLPLDVKVQQELRWLGMRTLGQYAALPPVSVKQRWGRVGVLAQEWAKGHDTRPVGGASLISPEPVGVDLEPATNQIGQVLEAILHGLRPTLARLNADFAGVRRLSVRLHFLPHEERTIDLVFATPTSQEARIHAALVQQLQALVWPGAADYAETRVLAAGEQMAEQMALFAEANETQQSGMMQTALRLSHRHGRIFFLGQVIEATHAVMERSFQWQAV